jgi:hypothetical protein
MQPEDSEDYDDLRKFFSLPSALASVDDVAKWLVGLTGVVGVIAGGFRVAQPGQPLTPNAEHRLSQAIIALAISLACSAVARLPLPMKVYRRSPTDMKAKAETLLIIRGVLVFVAVGAFVAALVFAALAN